MSRRVFYLFLFLYISALYYLSTTLPIGPNEAKVYYTDSSVLMYLTHFANGWFGNGLDFRLPFLFFGVLNIPLFFIMSRIYCEDIEQSYLATAIFALLPGIITASVIVNIAVVIISLVLIFIILDEKRYRFLQGLVMIGLLLIHDASVIFFIALAIFSAFRGERKLFVVVIIFAGVSLLYFNGLDIGGKPEGRFLELFGLYVALFSPLLFIYFFYALYRIWLRERKDMLWYISFTAFIFSILLSLRQKVDMTDFAPYVIVSVVLMLVTYNKTIGVRLPQFQKGYKLGYNIVVGSLILFSMVIIFHKLLFYIIDDKSKHFAYSFYKPYWIVKELGEVDKCYTAKRKKVQFQLRYYGVKECKNSEHSIVNNQ